MSLRIYGSKEVARLLGKSEGTISMYRRAGLLDGRKLGKEFLHTEAEVTAFLNLTAGETIPGDWESIQAAARRLKGRKEELKCRN